jgi:hypothetical protein
LAGATKRLFQKLNVDVMGQSDQDHRDVLLGQLCYPLEFR